MCFLIPITEIVEINGKRLCMKYLQDLISDHESEFKKAMSCSGLLFVLANCKSFRGLPVLRIALKFLVMDKH